MRVNEGVNASGILSNFAEREAKMSVWGRLPWDVRGGIFWTYSSGDHFSPQFRLSALGFYKYAANAGASPPSNPNDRYAPPSDSHGDPLDRRLFQALEGHTMFLGPRGMPNLERRAIFDLRLDREFQLRDYSILVSLDLFNALGMDAVTRVNTMANYGKKPLFDVPKTVPPQRQIATNQYYKAPLDRLPPRSLRLGAEFRF